MGQGREALDKQLDSVNSLVGLETVSSLSGMASIVRFHNTGGFPPELSVLTKCPPPSETVR